MSALSDMSRLRYAVDLPGTAAFLEAVMHLHMHVHYERSISSRRRQCTCKCRIDAIAYGALIGYAVLRRARYARYWRNAATFERLLNLCRTFCHNLTAKWRLRPGRVDEVHSPRGGCP
jgi:hypothetical protein